MSARYQLRNPSAERWDFLAGILPRGIEPTDIDLAIEAGHGHFLFAEGKRNGEPMPTGQRIFLERLRAPKSVTVVQFLGEPPDEIEAFGILGREPTFGDTADFIAAIRRWFEWAERQP